MPQLTHTYISRIPQREANLFLEEYYSGTDVRIFIDDDEQTEIGYISYSVNEQLKPLYGYSSRTWDDVAVGSRIVTGQLKIPIKNPASQSTYEEVILHEAEIIPTQELINSTNSESQTEKENTEWINDVEGEVIVADEVIQNYQAKLDSLGYNISEYTGILDGKTKQAIVAFCNDHGLVAETAFTTTVKNEIDDALQYSEAQQVNSNVIMRMGPDESYGLITLLNKGTSVYILGAEGSYTKIRTTSGVEGYILSAFLL